MARKKRASFARAVFSTVNQIWTRCRRDFHATRGRGRTPIEQLEPRLLLSTVTATSLSSLQSDISSANIAGGDQTIILGTSVTLTGSPLVLNDRTGTLTIEGSSSSITISGGGSSNVVTVDSSSSAEIEGLTIDDGDATGGGGINNSGTLTILDTTITGNFAVHGGGIKNTGLLYVSNATIGDNSADSTGGGIFNAGSGVMVVTDSTITGNSASVGGGVYTYGSSSSNNISDSTITGNVAGAGGGIDAHAGALTVVNSTLSGNSASAGGGFYDYGATSKIVDSTLSGNSATSSDDGGGIYNSSYGSVTLNGTIVANSTNRDLSGSFGGSNDLIDDTSAGTELTSSVLHPTYLGLGTLGTYGGPTETIPLLPGSPAIGAGTEFDGLGGEPITTDQRGGLRPTSSASDIGAFQLTDVTLNGDAGADTFDITVSGSGSSAIVNFTQNGTLVESLLESTLHNVTINGEGGTDNLIVDFSIGNPLPYGLNFNDSGDSSAVMTIIGDSGDDTINAGSTSVTFASSNYSGTDTLTYSSGTTVKTGSLFGNDSLTASAYSDLLFSSDVRGGSGNQVTLNVENHGKVAFAHTQHFYSITIAAGGQAQLQPGVSRVLVTDSLTIGAASGSVPEGILDLTNSGLVVHTASSEDMTSVASTLDQLLETGYAAGAWDGVGIDSSQAAAVSSSGALATLGIDAGTQYGGSAYHGESVGADDVVVAYTIPGDTNLDDVVNFTDELTLIANYGSTTANWGMGDFNYDGTANFSDLLTLSSNYGSTSGPSIGPVLYSTGEYHVQIPAASGSITQYELYWGDGSGAQFIAAPLSGTTTVSHYYGLAGSYNATIIAEGSTYNALDWYAPQSVTVSAASSKTNVSLSGGTFLLHLDSDGTEDDFYKWVSGSWSLQESVALSGSEGLGNIQIGTGTDSLTVDYSDGDPLPATLTGLNFGGSALNVTGTDDGTATVIPGAFLPGGSGISFKPGTSVNFTPMDQSATLYVAGDQLVNVSDAGAVSGASLSIEAGGGGTVLFPTSQVLSSLDIDAGGTVRMYPVGNNVLVVSGTLDIASSGETESGATNYTGVLDLANNDMILDGTSGSGYANLSAINDMLNTGSADSWSGNGINSNTSTTDANGTEDATMLSASLPATGQISFDGQTVDADDVLVQYTYASGINASDITSGPTTVPEGDAYIPDLPTTAPNGGTIYSWHVDWGDGTVTDSTTPISHTYATIGDFQPVTMAHLIGGGDYYFPRLDVNVSNIVATNQTINPIQGTSFDGVVADFQDGATGFAIGDISATINWGDGSSTPSVTYTSDGAGGYVITPTSGHTYSSAGTFYPTVTIVSTDGSTTTVDDSANVAGLIAQSETITGTLGVALSGITLADFTDTAPNASTNPSDYSATIDWNGGSGSTVGTISSDSNGGYIVKGTHTYSSAPTSAPTVTISLDGRSVTVSDYTDVTSITSPIGVSTLSKSQEVSTGTVPLGSFSISGYTGTGTGTTLPSGYSVNIDWGDGNSSTGSAVSIARSSSVFTASGSNTYATAGTFNPVVTITDPDGGTATINDTINVSGIQAEGQSDNAVQGQSFTGTLATFNEPYSGTYSAYIVWTPGGTADTHTTISEIGSSGIYTVAPASGYGQVFSTASTYNPVVTITDTDGSTVYTATATANVTVAGITASSNSITAKQGVALAGVQVASFSDNAPDAAIETYTASINWGDGTAPENSTGTITSDGSGGDIVTGSHTYSANGTYDPAVTITAVDGRTVTTTASAYGSASSYGSGSGYGSSGQASVSAITGSIGETIAPSQGSNFTGSVATFTSAGTDDPSYYTASINWGDGDTSSGIINYSSGTFTVIGSNTFLQAGNLNPTVTITDPGGVATTITATAHALGLVVTGQSVNAIQEQSYSGVLATFIDTASDASGYTDTSYTAVINWGDGAMGTGTVGTITVDGATLYTVSGSHTYDDGGDQSPTITIFALDTRSATATADMTVSGLSVEPVNVTANPGTAIPIDTELATFTDNAPDAAAQTYSATVAWNGLMAVSAAVASDGNGGFTVTTASSYTFSDAGPYNAVVTVTATGDSRATSATDSAHITSITSATGDTLSSVTQGAGYTGAVATFDDGTDSNPADYSASIAWGDGNTSSGIITPDSTGVFMVTGTNAFATARALNPVVTISDPAGETVTASAYADVAGITVTGATISPTQGASIDAGVVVATFSDNAPGASSYNESDYGAAINWGDGGMSPSTTIVGPAGGPYSVEVWEFDPHTYTAAGTFTPTVTVYSSVTGNQRYASGQGTANVAGLTVTEEDFNATVGTSLGDDTIIAEFTDSASGASTSPSGYKASIKWGDGTGNDTNTSHYSIDTLAGGGFDVLGDRAYSTAGDFSPVVTITATSGGDSGSATDSANVTSITSTSAGSPISSSAGSSISQTMATFGDTDTVAGHYGATIDWGDGNTTDGIVSYVGSDELEVTGDYTYQIAGSFTPVVTILDNNGAIVQVQDSASVAGMTGSGYDFNTAEGDPISGQQVASFTDSGSHTYTATVNWGDNSTSSGTITYSSGYGTVTASKSGGYSTVGESPVTVTISRTGQTLVVTGSAYVSTMTVSAYTSLTATQGETFQSDIEGPVPVATFTSSDYDLGDFNAVVDWGDGNTSNAGIDETSAGHYVISGTNTYSGYGTFHPIIAVTDSAYGGSIANIKDTLTVAQMATPTITSSSYSAGEVTLHFTASAPTTGYYPSGEIPYSQQFEFEGKDISADGNYSVVGEGHTLSAIMSNGTSVGGGLDSFTVYLPDNLPLGDQMDFRVEQTNVDNQQFTSSGYEVDLYPPATSGVPNVSGLVESGGNSVSFSVPVASDFPSDDGSVAVQYQVLDSNSPAIYAPYYVASSNPNVDYISLAYPTGGTSAYDPISLPPGDWSVQVRTASAGGDSGWSDPVTVDVAGTLTAPSVSVSEVAGMPTTYSFSWSGDGNAADRLVLYRSSGSSYSTYSAATGVGQNIATWVGDTGGSISNVTLPGDFYAAAVLYTSLGARSAPVILTGVAPMAASITGAVVVSPTEIDLTWQDNSDNESDFNIYRIEGDATGDGTTIPTGPSGATMIGTALADATSFQDTTCDPNTTYTYWVVAEDPAASQPVEVTTDILPLVSIAGYLDPHTGDSYYDISRSGPTTNALAVRIDFTRPHDGDLPITLYVDDSDDSEVAHLDATDTEAKGIVVIPAGDSSVNIYPNADDPYVLTDQPLTIQLVQRAHSPYSVTDPGELTLDYADEFYDEMLNRELGFETKNHTSPDLVAYYLRMDKTFDVGIGHNLGKQGQDTGAEVFQRETDATFDQVKYHHVAITADDAYSMFGYDLSQKLGIADSGLSDYEDLPDKVKQVVIDFLFNHGSFSGFPNFEKDIDAGNWAWAAADLKYVNHNKKALSAYYQQVTDRAEENIDMLNELARDAHQKIQTE